MFVPCPAVACVRIQGVTSGLVSDEDDWAESTTIAPPSKLPVTGTHI